MPGQQNTDPRSQPRHSIAVASRRTGLSQVVLRAWERRYSAVVPSRTPTGRRQYSDRDLEKLTLLGRLTNSGHRIGDVAGLPLDDLRQAVRESAAGGASASQAAMPQRAEAADLMRDALQAVTVLDSRGLEAVLDRALVDLSKPELRKQLLVPLLEEIGRRWKDGRLRVAHEHMASGVIMGFLSALNSRYRVAMGAPVLAVTTPSGQLHELGVQLVASHTYEAGWDVLYLGPNLPAEDIAAAVAGGGVQAVLLSLIFPRADARGVSELRELRRLLGPEVPILATGQAAASYDVVLAEIGARLLSEPDDLAPTLASI